MYGKLLTTAVLASLAAATPLAKRGFTGPVFPDNFPDPSIIQVGDTWYAFSTPSLGVNNPVAKSAPGNFNSWSLVKNADGSQKDALPKVGKWSNGQDTWAPNVIQVGNKFVMYHTGKSADGSTHCIGAASSSNVEGPYTDQDEAIACPASVGGAIDPSGFVDTDGSIYVVYKIDGNSIGHGGSCNNGVAPIVPTPIMLQKMDSTGLRTDGSKPIIILDRSDADGPYVEAPSLGKVDNTYFLFFSSGCYTESTYDVSYAYSHTGITANGQNYTKQQAPNAPLLVTGTTQGKYLYAPGGLAFAADGKHVAFMADESQQTGANTRQMYVGEVTVNATAATVHFT